MSVLPIEKKLLLGALALATVLVPVVFGTVGGRIEAQSNPGAQPQPQILVRIAPLYPEAALAAKLEGEVNLQFTIAANGTTKDIFVVDSTAPEFEAPAITALSRWRYAPTTTGDGEAVEVPGMRTIIRFALDAPRANPND
jgi:TonB family protein